MQNNEMHIESDYADDSNETRTVRSGSPSDEFEIEMQKYGTGKPTRRVIRARMAHGDEDQDE